MANPVLPDAKARSRVQEFLERHYDPTQDIEAFCEEFNSLDQLDRDVCLEYLIKKESRSMLRHLHLVYVPKGDRIADKTRRL